MVLAYLLSSVDATENLKLSISLNSWHITDRYPSEEEKLSNAKSMSAMWTTLTIAWVAIWAPPCKTLMKAKRLCICPSLTSMRSWRTSSWRSWKWWRLIQWSRPPARTSPASSGPAKKQCSNRRKAMKVTHSPDITCKNSDNHCHFKRCRARRGLWYPSLRLIQTRRSKLHNILEQGLHLLLRWQGVAQWCRKSVDNKK